MISEPPLEEEKESDTGYSFDRPGKLAGFEGAPTGSVQPQQSQTFDRGPGFTIVCPLRELERGR
jgi:hypothetical protein